ncbi:MULTISPECIES: histidine phosphatase family protein [Anaerotruncus]|uniref:histidine phosphatase family protein n=2 Tax=Oscillospiraceae TaxID=216572 RepID=UPI0008314D53|nr:MULTISPECIES: histidine phosphatase family protein [Anaerotruncus]
MTTLYLIRHAQAEGNWKRIFQGHTDGQVSEVGERQLAHLAKRFENIHLDAIYASPLARTMQTAQAVNHDQLHIIKTQGLMELDGGDFEGVPFADLASVSPEQAYNWDHDLANFHAPNGESIREVYARMRDTVNRIVQRHPHQTVAIVSHGGALRSFLCFASGLGPEQIARIPWCDNTAVSKVLFDRGFTPTVSYLNDNSHLPEADSTFAKQTWWKRHAT